MYVGLTYLVIVCTVHVMTLYNYYTLYVSWYNNYMCVFVLYKCIYFIYGYYSFKYYIIDSPIKNYYK